MRTVRHLLFPCFILFSLLQLRADDLYRMPPGLETRWASAENPQGGKGAGGTTQGGRKGSASMSLKSGATQVLAEVDNAGGMIHRIWLTIDKRTPQTLREIRIEFYWDGAKKPAVSVPLGDFFGAGNGELAAFQSALFSSPEGRSFNCVIPMPFRTGMKIQVINESHVDIAMLFYDVDYTIGDRYGDDMLYFHAWFNRVNPTRPREDYVVLPRVPGRGRFLGVNIGVIADQKQYYESWWGEGEVKVYLDGDIANPTLCGTGSEDYAGSGWGLGAFSHLYQGCTYANSEKLSYCFYRYHIPDPIYFHSDIRVTIQQLGCWGPNCIAEFREAKRPIYSAERGTPVDWSDPKLAKYGIFERQDDVSSCAYFYLDRPEDDLPALMPAEERSRGLPQK